MRYERHDPEQKISPALKAAALEAARLVSLAIALEDAADLTGLRHDAPVVEAIMRLRDELKAQAAQIMKDYTKERNA